MKKHKLPFTLFFALIGNFLFAQSPETIKKYIATYKDIAIEEMQRTGVPAAITLAQGIHETGAGTSPLVLSSNNHFGIKCKSEWRGASVRHDDDAKGECFRKYSDPLESYKDHSDFLKNRPFYVSLFTLDPTDYKAWALGLKKAGYATNPKYAQVLIKLIEDYDLQAYSLIALTRKIPDNPVWVNNRNTTESSEQTRPVTETMIKISYPSGVFKINETSVVFVTRGTSFLMVASDNNISLSRLFEFNDMKPVDVAYKDQLIYLQRKRRTGANEFHTVVSGETLYDIAQTEGIRIENLLEYNYLRLNMQPQTGEKLFLKTKAPAMPKLVFEDSREAVSINSSMVFQTVNKIHEETGYIVHIVQPKETVYAIAKKYSVAMVDVMKWNDLQNNDLKPGQSIRINKSNADASN